MTARASSGRVERGGGALAARRRAAEPIGSTAAPARTASAGATGGGARRPGGARPGGGQGILGAQRDDVPGMCGELRDRVPPAGSQPGRGYRRGGLREAGSSASSPRARGSMPIRARSWAVLWAEDRVRSAWSCARLSGRVAGRLAVPQPVVQRHGAHGHDDQVDDHDELHDVERPLDPGPGHVRQLQDADAERRPRPAPAITRGQPGAGIVVLAGELEQRCRAGPRARTAAGEACRRCG